MIKIQRGEEEHSRSEESQSGSGSEESTDTDAAVDSGKVDNKTGAGIDNTVDVDDVNVSKYDIDSSRGRIK